MPQLPAKADGKSLGPYDRVGIGAPTIRSQAWGWVTEMTDWSPAVLTVEGGVAAPVRKKWDGGTLRER